MLYCRNAIVLDAGLWFGYAIQVDRKTISRGHFVYTDYGDAKIRNDLLKGKYDRNDIFFFAVNASWKF